MTMETITIDFEKGGGLVPAIIQDAHSRQVLMMGYKLTTKPWLQDW